MKLGIVGSRSFSDYATLEHVIHSISQSHFLDEIISGGAQGADSLAKQYAEKWKIQYVEFPADWSKGKGAGLERNTEIVNASDMIVAFWDLKSKGTKDSINKTLKIGKQVLIVPFKPTYRDQPNKITKED